ncbi:hypothetical protein H4J59_15855 [Colwellia sp. MB02u-10]|uniref:PKD domain-containing protein n=1 Tax=Colwellia sp. MB02u-10 TaxID=2759828 RepID=UPI0015F70A2A|nr:hypothetical protein [Colwellia sp. MB02u-10]MBA6342467.1 hypothetical protein [Colwellia sp. MB02u-10]
MFKNVIKNNFIRSSVFAAICTSSSIANADEIRVVFSDAEGVGFNSQEAYVPEGGNNATTLGEARKNVLFRTIRMIESQINITSDFAIEVEFEALSGYGAITLGPSFSSFDEGGASPYGIMEVNRQYPTNLRYSLQNIDTSSWDIESDPVSSTQFSPNSSIYLGFDNEGQHRSFITTTLHELTHVMGFASLNCLGDCFPAPLSKPSHFTKFVFGEGDPLVVFDNLSIREQEEVVSSGDGLLFLGSTSTQSKLSGLLTGGIHNGAVELHADGQLDGQEIAHFSPNVYPEQLMASVGSNVLNLGAAAYVLCDIGWCRGSGKVIDIGLNVENTKFKALPNDGVYVDFNIENATDAPASDLLLEIRFPEGTALSNALLENGQCTINNNALMSCTAKNIGANETLDVHFMLSGNIGDYALSGELSSTSFDVDSNGNNNLFDIEFTATSNQAPQITLDESVNANEGDNVSIIASVFDSDDDELTYSWTQISGPDVTLTDADMQHVKVTAPQVSKNTDLVLKFSVSDGEDEVSQNITVSVANVPKTDTEQSKESSGGSFGWILVNLFGLALFRKFKRANPSAHSSK